MEVSEPIVEQVTEEEKRRVDAQVQETIRKVNKIFLDKKFDSMTYIINYLSHDASSPERMKTDEVLKEQKIVLQQCITPLVDVYYNNFNDSLHILNDIYQDFSGTQEHIANLYSYTQKVSEIINMKKEGLQDLYMQKLKMQYLLEILHTVEKIKNCIQVIEDYEKQKKYIMAVDHLIEIENLLQTPPFSEFPSFSSIKQDLSEKKKALQLQIYDKLSKLVHYEDEIQYSNYSNTSYHEEITSEIESIIIYNGEYTCDPCTVIRIYITALTKLGYCYDTEIKLKSSLYNKMISLYSELAKKTCEEKNNAMNIFDKLSKEEEQERDIHYFTKLINTVMTQYEIIITRYFTVIDSIEDSIKLYNHITSNKTDKEFTYERVTSITQKAVEALVAKFIQPIAALSTKSSMAPSRSNHVGNHLSYRFMDSTAWMNNITSRDDVKKTSSVFNDICECSVTNFIYIYQDLMNFYNRLIKLTQEHISLHPDVVCVPESNSENSDVSLVSINLKDYCIDFIKTSLADSYSESLKNYIVSICNESTAFQESTNQNYSSILNLSVNFVNRFVFISKQILSLDENYIYVLPSIEKYFSGYSAKYSKYLDDSLKSTYTYKRHIWLGQDGIDISRSEKEFKALEEELSYLKQTHIVLSTKHKLEKEESLEGDMLSLCVEPAIRQEDLIPNDIIIRFISVANSLFWSIQEISNRMEKNEIETNCPIKESQIEFKNKVIEQLYLLKDLYFKVIFILRQEVRTRLYFYIQKMRYENITLCAVHVSEFAPPLYIYNLYNDINTLLTLYSKMLTEPKYLFICSGITNFLPLLLIKSVPRLNITEVSPAIINSYKQSIITVQQIFRLYMKPSKALDQTKHLSTYFSLLDSDKNTIEHYIQEHPYEFSYNDLNSLFKYPTANHKEDPAAIDWIMHIIRETKQTQK